jgi:hypothetical protein
MSLTHTQFSGFFPFYLTDSRDAVFPTSDSALISSPSLSQLVKLWWLANGFDISASINYNSELSGFDPLSGIEMQTDNGSLEIGATTVPLPTGFPKLPGDRAIPILGFDAQPAVGFSAGDSMGTYSGTFTTKFTPDDGEDDSVTEYDSGPPPTPDVGIPRYVGFNSIQWFNGILPSGAAPTTQVMYDKATEAYFTRLSLKLSPPSLFLTTLYTERSPGVAAIETGVQLELTIDGVDVDTSEIHIYCDDIGFTAGTGGSFSPGMSGTIKLNFNSFLTP